MMLRQLSSSGLACFALVLGCNQDEAGVIVIEDAVVTERPTEPTAQPGTLLPSEPGGGSEGPAPNTPPPAGPAPVATAPVSAPPCGVDADCSGGTVCSSGLCLAECAGHQDCAAAGLICDFGTSRCAECVTDETCPTGQVCAAGSCVVGTPAPATPEPSADDDVTVEPPADDDVAVEPEVAPADDDVTADDDTAIDPPADDDVVEAEPVPVEPSTGCTTMTFDPCSEGLPKFSGTQNVDGDPSDFCDVPVAVLNLSSAALTIGDPAGQPHTAEIRVAWSETALHVHATVTDPAVFPEAPLDTWSGDSLDVYVGSSSSVSGSLGNDGTPQLILAPPSPDGSRGASLMRYPAQEEVTSGYAAMTTSTGYVVEMSYPWPGGVTLASGATIKLNFALNVREQSCPGGSDLNSCRQYYGAYFAGSGGSPSDCDGYTLLSGRTAEPWCDNRTWCSPTLR